MAREDTNAVRHDAADNEGKCAIVEMDELVYGKQGMTIWGDPQKYVVDQTVEKNVGDSTRWKLNNASR